MKKITSAFICLLCYLLMINSSSATHIMGGDLTYEWISGNDYTFTYTFYRDCSGIDAPIIEQLYLEAPSCGQSLTTTLFLASSGPVTSICSSGQTTCDGGMLFGFQKYLYQATFTLPANCSDWKFHVEECCRNTAITNLVDPGNHSIYLEATLDNSSTPFNNSIRFSNDPVFLIFVNQTQHINNGIYDTDGDSLTIELANPMDTAGVNIPYLFPYSVSNPIASNPALSFDPVSGDMIVSPDQLQVDVVSYLIKEYRNGVVIGTAMRDVQVIVVDEANQLPELSGIDGSNQFYSFTCPGDTLSFTVNSSDADTNQVLTMTWDSTIIGASFVVSGSAAPSGTFTWVPDSSDINSQPHVFTITVKDDACPYNGIQTYSYLVYVSQCNTSNVWPGDANADYTVNMYDVLPIGIAFGTTGNARPSASFNWVAQSCTDWLLSFQSGVNYKHADCDGNGIVENADFDAITLNYGLQHLKPEPGQVREGAPLFLDIASSTSNAGNYSIPIQFGNSSVQLSNVYGLVYTLSVDPSFIVPGTLSIDNSSTWLGNSSNLEQMLMPFPVYGYIDAGIVRLDHQPVSGYGTIGKLNFTSAVQDPQWLHFTFSNVMAINENGEEIAVGSIDDSILINSTVSAHQPSLNNFDLQIYPNPSTGEFNLELIPDKSESIVVEIIDVMGRTVAKINEQVISGEKKIISANISSLENGSYCVRVKGEHLFSEKKILLSR